MEEKNNLKAWLYLLPSLFFIGAFMIYPLIDVFVYALEENYSSLTETYTGIGFENFIFIFMEDSDFLLALKNTALLVIITVPISTIIALLIAVLINSIKIFQKAFQVIFFLPYVTNVLAIGMVFQMLFQPNTYNYNGIINVVLGWFGVEPAAWLAGADYSRKMLVLSTYIIWNVMPFKIIVLIGALQSVKKDYYDAASLDGASRFKKFRRITVPLISPMISYLVITGFIGAFKEYNNVIAIFGSDKQMDSEGMSTVVGRIYYYLYSDNITFGTHPSYAAAAAIVLLTIVMFITGINLLVSKKAVHY